MVLHADCAKDGTHGAGGASLFSDYLADITRRYPQSKYSTFLAFDCFNYDCIRFIDQGAGNFGYQLLHIIRAFFVRHCLGPPLRTWVFHSRARAILSVTSRGRQGILGDVFSSTNPLSGGGDFGFSELSSSRLSGLCSQLRYALGELCTLACPVVDPITLQVDRRWISARVVGANHFDRAAIARPFLLDHNHAIVWLLARAYARQTNHQHRTKSFQLLFGDTVQLVLTRKTRIRTQNPSNLV